MQSEVQGPKIKSLIKNQGHRNYTSQLYLFLKLNTVMSDGFLTTLYFALLAIFGLTWGQILITLF